MSQLRTALDAMQQELIACARDMVRIQSYPGREESMARYVEAKMRELGYDDVAIDAMGNVLGRLGTGTRSILFDAHMDTVEVADADDWTVPPFDGAIIDGRLCGRGSVDMKSALAAALHAPLVARQLGWLGDSTVYVSATVMEEDCDGENLRHMFDDAGVRPDCVVVCEPSGNCIALGHRGKAQLVVRTRGVSAHGASPEKGRNAIYEMAEIITRVEALNDELTRAGAGSSDRPGTAVLSRISSTSASLNAVPSACEIYIDRRLALGEDEETVRAEMERIVAGRDAEWEIGTLRRTSWTGLTVTYRPMHASWQIDEAHPLTRACVLAYERAFDRPVAPFRFWDFSTNAVTPVAMGIPTIGFGPGDPELAHMRDESCPVDDIAAACGFYATLIHETSSAEETSSDV